MKKKHVTFGCAGQHEVKVYSSNKSTSTHKSDCNEFVEVTTKNMDTAVVKAGLLVFVNF